MSTNYKNDGVSRLCFLFRRNLHPFTEFKAEKKLLIILSQILGQIRRWIDDDDDEHQQQFSRFPCFDSVSVEHDCLANVTSILIPLLNVDDKYTQHLVCKNFLVISEFLLASGEGDSWDKFIRLLCASFEFGLCNVLHPSFNGVENLKSIPANLSPVLHDFTWTGVAGIVGVLRVILKHLKGEEDVGLVVIVVDSLSTSLSEVPWDYLNHVRNDSSTDVKGSSGERNPKVKILFVGNFLQLLCSLVGLVGSVEPEAGFLDKEVILHKVCDLVPKIAHWCLAKEQSFIHGSILTYFQHKVLMLMIRLSFYMQPDCPVLLLWLQLLHDYFQVFLSRPLSVIQCGQDDSLEGSPFLLSLYDQDTCDLSSRHLQRQTVSLFVRSCLSLIVPRNSTDMTVAGKRTSSFFDGDVNITDNYFATKKGILELYGWLQDKVPLDIVSENQMYLEKCIKFISSVITLFIHEDDMLFEALLQMLSLSSYPEGMFSKDGRSSNDTEEDILFYISVLFNPLLVLHVFLSELQYDHQLLLDYLISKDTGSKCAEYLLRCLRIICDSWNPYLQLLNRETCFCLSNYKKSFKRARTILEDSCAEQVPNPVNCSHTGTFKQYEKAYQPGSKILGNYSIRVQDVKACLLSLKCTLKNLHKKKLFPYNPEVLIRRITRFEALCDENV